MALCLRKGQHCVKYMIGGLQTHPALTSRLVVAMGSSEPQIAFSSKSEPGSNFFEKMPLFFRYSGVNAANAANLQAKRS